MNRQGWAVCTAVALAAVGCGDFDTGGGGEGANVNFSSGYAFARDGDIYVADKADYQANKRLTSRGADSAPSLSRDGRVVVFVRTDPASGMTSLRKIATSGSGDAEVVAGSSDRVLSQPAVSRDGSRVAFVSTRVGSGSAVATVISIDGSGEAPVPGSARDGSPSFFADGKYLLLLTGPNTLSHDELVKVEISAGVRTRVVGTTGLGRSAQVSPDGTRVAFEKRKGDGRMGIFVADVAGGSPQQLADTGGNDLAPTFVTLGRVGFTSDVGGLTNVYESDVGSSTDAYRLTVGAAEQCSYGG